MCSNCPPVSKKSLREKAEKSTCRRTTKVKWGDKSGTVSNITLMGIDSGVIVDTLHRGKGLKLGNLEAFKSGYL